MTVPTTRWWALVSPGTDETAERPHGLFRVVRDDAGLHVQRLTEAGGWMAAPALYGYVCGEDTGAVEVSAAAAAVLEARPFPWPWLTTEPGSPPSG